MRKTSRLFLSFLFGVLLLAGGSLVFGAGLPSQTLNLPDTEAFGAMVDADYVPDVTARVARISFIRGAARIKRLGAAEWENAALNLPLVEGDEIVTDAGGRVEIQFDKNQHLRIDENAYLKVVNLKDEGIAVSLSLGTLNLRITSFDKDRSYFEIDAPKTTIAVQRTGTYRVDSGREGDTQIRIAATNGGEARVYSDNAGFTLKNGRSTAIYIDGANSGEWQTAEASRYADEFDDWASDRDSAIAGRLKDAYYDRYYDDDIYGADDLNDYGQWVHTPSYGYVWRPHRTSISRYADWSPYRYGHWRWMQPYGWIWVNDEPWGWATYHHGRWVYYGGYWNWSPYGYYRTSRSWWFPALVVINVFNNNVCWYPLPYNYGYYNYNGHHNNHYGGHHNNNNNGHNNNLGYAPPLTPTGGIKPIPSPTPGGVATIKIRTNGSTAVDTVPPTGVVTVPSNTFGTSIKGIKTASASLADTVLSIKPAEIKPSLPSYAAVDGRVGRDIASDRPKINIAVQTRAGAAPRNTDKPLDNDLRTTRVFGGRPPVENNENGGTKPVRSGSTKPRTTGAIERPPAVTDSDPVTPVRQPPVNAPPRVRDDTQNSPVRVPRSDTPTRVPPQSDSPPVRQPPRSDPAPVRQPPRYNPPPQQTPRDDPPVRQPPRSDPPPVKSDPKPSPKPQRKADGNG